MDNCIQEKSEIPKHTIKDCIFCKIVKGDIPCYKVFEDEEFLAFLDITPKKEGHTLVIPKNHYRWIWDIKEDYSNSVNKVAKALQKAFKTDWVVSMVMGEEVPHAHIHLVPRTQGDGHGSLIKRDAKVELSKEQFEEIAEKIKNSF